MIWSIASLACANASATAVSVVAALIAVLPASIASANNACSASRYNSAALYVSNSLIADAFVFDKLLAASISSIFSNSTNVTSIDMSGWDFRGGNYSNLYILYYMPRYKGVTKSPF